MDSTDLLPASEEAKFLNDPYNERWAFPKPVIVELYMGRYGPGGKKMTIQQVADFMKHNYSFYGAGQGNAISPVVSRWGVRKRTEAREKDDVASALGKRSCSGTRTSDVTLYTGDVEKAVDKRQLTRHLKAQMGRYQPEQLTPGVFSSWNLPYAAYVKCLSRVPGQPSPFGETSTTPAYLTVHSPAAVTPGRQVAPSPTMQLVQQKAVQDRSNLLLQGRFADLLMSCSKEDRVALMDYLHDFHIHSFVTAKYWGRGPKTWTAGMVSALTLGSMDSAGTPSSSVALSPSGSSRFALPSASEDKSRRFKAPTDLCRWSIHVPNIDYVLSSEQLEDPRPPEEFDIENPSWPSWTEQDLTSASLLNTMRESISTSAFTGAAVEHLPVSVGVISQSVKKDPTALLVDSWRFAIISGNLELLERLEEQQTEKEIPIEVMENYPLHLAASYLDGGNNCCMVFQSLLHACPVQLGPHYDINDTGHTILDSLLLSVLRSHTSVSPDNVGPGTSSLNRYPGEEKDICGRWDADSPAVRELFGHGYARIPTDWKHPFCHTATQAICHAAITLFSFDIGPDINAPSGLFVRRCTSCGLELKPGPIHTLVVLSFYLAHKGMPGETLFGVMAVLVCLIRLGASVSASANISVGEILGTTESEGCHHTRMTPCDLIAAVPGHLIDRWTDDCRIAWDCIGLILRLGEVDETKYELGGMNAGSGVRPHSAQGAPQESVCDGVWFGPHGEWIGLPCGSHKLGALWATIQVEFLTYRRIEEGAPWISKNFSMHALRAWLAGETEEFCTPLVENNMMKHHLRCGWFIHEEDFRCPVAEEVCVEHFMNMDIYSRATFVERRLFHEWG